MSASGVERKSKMTDHVDRVKLFDPLAGVGFYGCCS